MKILYECDLAGSRYHGMAYRIFQFSKEFVRLGHDVMIVAASYSHVRRKNPVVEKIVTDEIIDGIKYRWLKTPSYKGNGLGRVFHMVFYNYRLWKNAARIAKDFQPDVVIASGVTPLDFIGCHKIAKIAKAKKIIEIGDLWPLSPIELGGYSRLHPFIMFMQWAENYAYKNTDAVISLLPCSKEHMVQHGLVPDKFNYIPNGIIVENWENPQELPSEHKNVITQFKREGKFLVGFAGTHSISNALFTTLAVAQQLENKNVEFILVGNGPIKEELKRFTVKHKIKNVTFLPPIDKFSIPSFLNCMDVLYIGFQKQSVYRFGISPNKIFDYMMASKPIIQAIDAGNNLVKEANCGIDAEPENSDAIADAILKLLSMSEEERSLLGKNGYRFVNNYHNYNVLAQHFIEVITHN